MAPDASPPCSSILLRRTAPWRPPIARSAAAPAQPPAFSCLLAFVQAGSSFRKPSPRWASPEANTLRSRWCQDPPETDPDRPTQHTGARKQNSAETGLTQRQIRKQPATPGETYPGGRSRHHKPQACSDTPPVCKTCVGPFRDSVRDTHPSLRAHTHTSLGRPEQPHAKCPGTGTPAASQGGKVSWRTMAPSPTRRADTRSHCQPGRPGSCPCVWGRKAGGSPGPPAPTCPPGDPVSSRASCLVLQSSRGLARWPTFLPLGVDERSSRCRITRGRAWWSKVWNVDPNPPVV